MPRRLIASLSIAAVVVLVVVIPLVAGWRDAQPTAVPLDGLPDTGTFRIVVADWGYHTSIIVQQPAGMHLGPSGAQDAPYVEYAWGDRRFYMEEDHSPSALFAALFLPTASVTYVEGWPRAPDATTPARALFAREISAAQLRLLLESVEAGISRAPATQRAAPFAPVPGYAGRFYPSPYRYLWTRDCNRWTVERLAAAGLAHGGRGVLFSGQVGRHLVGFQLVARRTGRRAANPLGSSMGTVEPVRAAVGENQYDAARHAHQSLTSRSAPD